MSGTSSVPEGPDRSVIAGLFVAPGESEDAPIRMSVPLLLHLARLRRPVRAKRETQRRRPLEVDAIPASLPGAHAGCLGEFSASSAPGAGQPT
jgi:hypothetical protein